MPLEREINRAASICLTSRTFPERSIALSNIAAKSGVHAGCGHSTKPRMFMREASIAAPLVSVIRLSSCRARSMAARQLMTHMRHQPPVFAVTHNTADGVVSCSVR